MTSKNAPRRPLRADLTDIFNAAVESVDPYLLVRKRLTLGDEVLAVSDRDGTTEHAFDLTRFRRIIAVGAGKATAPMAKAVEELLSDRLESGIISVKPGHTTPLSTIRMVEAGHPVPNDGSVRAASEIAELLKSVDDETLVLALVSGGASALLELPLELQSDRLTLADIQQTTRALLACGAPIAEINTVRKHLSQIKGGRFARMCAPGTVLSLIISDVVGDRLEAIGSGITCADPTSFHDAAGIFDKYEIHDQVPESVHRAIAAGVDGRIEETPKPGDPAFERVFNVLLGTNHTALMAASDAAERLGYAPLILTSRLTGEAREVGSVLAGIAYDLVDGRGAARPPAAILCGGETTVTLHGAGRGGRNQEIAVSVLSNLLEAYGGARFPATMALLSAATDGNDGPTDAAGGFVDAFAFESVQETGADPAGAMRENDSYPFLERIDSLFRPGPTKTNVCDIQIILVR